MTSARRLFYKLLKDLVRESKKHWGKRLRGVLLFGSTADHLKPSADIDLMFAVERLQKHRPRRIAEFDEIEKKLQRCLHELQEVNVHLRCSPILRTPTEWSYFSPLYLDLPERSLILYDPDRLFKRILQRTTQWIKSSGAKKIKHGLLWYWDLNPSMKSSEEITLGWGKL